MRLSILMVSRSLENSAAFLRSLDASSVAAHHEVIVSWNGDPAERDALRVLTRAQLRAYQIEPYHFAQNNNAIAEMAEGEIFAFINDDIVLDRGALDAAVACFDNPAVGIVGGRLRYGDGRLQHAGVYFRDDNTPYHVDKLTHEIDAPKHRASKFVPAVTGAFLFIRGDEFRELMFDEAYEVAGEDIDLCLRYRRQFDREIYYCAEATAQHLENVTRKITGTRTTPPASLDRLRSVASGHKGDMLLNRPCEIRVAIKTEKPGWIMHRQASEIANQVEFAKVSVNDAIAGADVAYYINYGYFERRHGNELVVANFTHFDADNLAQKFIDVANECDHCIAVSSSTRSELISLGIAAEKISVIENGADASFRPRAVLGIAGRVYPGGRKGEDLVAQLLADAEVCAVAHIVAADEGWGAPVWRFDDRRDFFHAIDLLLIPSRKEGGPVPFFEALASGKLAIAPEIGVAPDYPHLTYEAGNFESLRACVLRAASEIVRRRETYSRYVADKTWEHWAHAHELVFRNLVHGRRHPR
ncbi:MAG: glycosyltransferase [Terricaulis sp.]